MADFLLQNNLWILLQAQVDQQYDWWAVLLLAETRSCMDGGKNTYSLTKQWHEPISVDYACQKRGGLDIATCNSINALWTQMGHRKPQSKWTRKINPLSSHNHMQAMQNREKTPRWQKD